MYISLCGVDPQYKLPVATLERLSHPVSQTGPFVVEGRVPNMKNQLSRNFQQTIVLGLPNCQIVNRAIRFAFDSLLE